MYLDVNDVTEYYQLKESLRFSYSNYKRLDNEEIATAKLKAFTLEKRAKDQSRENLKQIFECASQLRIPVVIVKQQVLQFAGHSSYISSTNILDEEAIDQLKDGDDSARRWSGGPRWREERSSYGIHLLDLSGYFTASWALNNECGYYTFDHRVNEYIKITNRHQQIQQLWDFGWPARRGRPVSIGYERHSGSRDELDDLTKFAKSLETRRTSSEVAKRAVANYRSINREYAWPGSW